MKTRSNPELVAQPVQDSYKWHVKYLNRKKVKPCKDTANILSFHLVRVGNLTVARSHTKATELNHVQTLFANTGPRGTTGWTTPVAKVCRGVRVNAARPPQCVMKEVKAEQPPLFSHYCLSPCLFTLSEIKLWPAAMIWMSLVFLGNSFCKLLEASLGNYHH
eukprot:5668588-Amphidinium_carterae.1